MVWKLEATVDDYEFSRLYSEWLESKQIPAGMLISTTHAKSIDEDTTVQYLRRNCHVLPKLSLLVLIGLNIAL